MLEIHFDTRRGPVALDVEDHAFAEFPVTDTPTQRMPGMTGSSERAATSRQDAQPEYEADFSISRPALP